MSDVPQWKALIPKAHEVSMTAGRDVTLKVNPLYAYIISKGAKLDSLEYISVVQCLI